MSQDITDTITGHRIGFGETVDDDDFIFYLIETRDTAMLTIIGQFRIDLIGDRKDPVFLYYRNDLSIVFIFHDATGRITREVQDDSFRFITDDLFKCFRCKFEFILFRKFNFYHFGTSHFNDSSIGYISRGRKYDFITRFDDRP